MMPSILDLPPLLDVDEVAELLRLHPVTVRVKLRRGEIPGTKISSNRWRIPRSYVTDLLGGGV